LIDRPIRPLFPDGYRHDVQVISLVLSVDRDASPQMAAMLGSSLALGVSDIPFEGPIAGVTVGLTDGEFIVNPSEAEMENSEIDLQVAGTKDAVNMVEAGAKEVTEETMLEAIMFGHENIREMVGFQEDILAELDVVKSEFDQPQEDLELSRDIEEKAYTMGLYSAIQHPDKQTRDETISAAKERILETLDEEAEDYEEVYNEASGIVERLLKNEVRRLITEDKIRPDGREPS